MENIKEVLDLLELIHNKNAERKSLLLKADIAEFEIEGLYSKLAFLIYKEKYDPGTPTE